MSKNSDKDTPTRFGMNITKFANWVKNLEVQSHHVIGIGSIFFGASAVIIGAVGCVEYMNSPAFGTFMATSAGLAVLATVFIVPLISGYAQHLGYYLETQKAGESDFGPYKSFKIDLVAPMAAAGILIGIAALSQLMSYYAAQEMGAQAGLSFAMSLGVATLISLPTMIYIVKTMNEKKVVDDRVKNPPSGYTNRAVNLSFNSGATAYEKKIVSSSSSSSSSITPIMDKKHTLSYALAAGLSTLFIASVAASSTAVSSVLLPMLEAYIQDTLALQVVGVAMIIVPTLLLAPLAHRIAEDLLDARAYLDATLST